MRGYELSSEASGLLIPHADESSDQWVIDADKTKDHWLEINDGEGWWSAVVKWDGCVDLTRYFNAPWGENVPEHLPDGDTMHICDIDDLIERLQALKAIALTHFNGNWPA